MIGWVAATGSAIIRRLSQSRAIALDMESAAIAANGFRFRVPYGTLLCVSDKPRHGDYEAARREEQQQETQAAMRDWRPGEK